VKLLKEEFGFDDAFKYISKTDWNAGDFKNPPKFICIING
jgi:hypothetical protein